MDWWHILLLIFFSLLALMILRVPVAFSFLAINIVAAIFLWGGEVGLRQLMGSIESSLATFALAPIPLFILMGEIMFHTGIAPRMIDSLDKWFGKVPGRLSLLAVTGGTLISTLTGSTMASTSMLGSTLVPEMERRQYKNQMSIGPILGSGTLAALIPPSALGVLLASMGQISIGAFMIAIILPGVLMAILFGLYIIIRAKLQPELAPNYDVASIPLSEKIKATVVYIFPLSLIIFLVVGLMFLGIATPTEAAAMGSIGSLLLAAYYKQLNFHTLKLALNGTLKISAMMLMIIAGSTGFSQILSFSGATSELVRMIASLDVSVTLLVIGMLLIVLVLGSFMESLSILMVCLPIFIPIANTLGIDLLWFAAMLLITIEIGTISPPFGTGLFVMKAVAPKGVRMGQVYAAAFPFICLDLLLVAVIMIFPPIATWLPTLMRT